MRQRRIFLCRPGEGHELNQPRRRFLHGTTVLAAPTYLSLRAAFHSGACQSCTWTSSKVFGKSTRPISTLAQSGVAGWMCSTRAPARTRAIKKALNSRRKARRCASLRMIPRLGSRAWNSTTGIPVGWTARLETLMTAATNTLAHPVRLRVTCWFASRKDVRGCRDGAPSSSR